ncbi:MAG: ABC transporter ATP-binding protein [Dehalococcoidia bacterium]|jgi:ABC-2 type transport system ATP-binding protein|nr:ABC transporter ATP-binding protein [Dehalococcoidia bacterium]
MNEAETSLDARPSAIEVRNLTKRFGEVTAVDDISFTVAAGELFGFLGPNGAGKTTTINMLTGLARPLQGKIRVGGIDCSRKPKAAQHLMGIVPDESNLYPELSGFQNLCFCGALYGMARADRESRAQELLGLFDLSNAAQRKFAAYSRGMKRRLTIAAGIMHRPSILFLDEPTTGIDIASARQVRQMIGELNRAGTTVFLTTHYIEEAERLCRRVAFIVSGRIVREDHVSNLMRQVEGNHVVEFAVSTATPEMAEMLAAAFPGTEFDAVTRTHFKATSTTALRVGSLVVFLEEHGIAVSEARESRMSLEDVFVRVTGLGSPEMKREKERMGGGGAQ